LAHELNNANCPNALFFPNKLISQNVSSSWVNGNKN